MDEQERSEQDEGRNEAPEEASPEVPATESATEQEQDAGIDAAKLSDEEATLAARAFLGTAEPEEQVSVDEAKKMLRRAGAVAEAEPEVAAPAPEPEPEKPAGAAPAAEPQADTGRRWYVIHTYSGYENKVKTNLEHRIQSMDMGDKIFQVLVPTEEEIEIKNGKRHPVERKIFPGYVLVEMVMSDDSWYVVRNTPGVTSFVGSGNKPTELTDTEVRAILRQIKLDAPKYKVAFT
jgi:transcriptional antiterminator NusG